MSLALAWLRPDEMAVRTDDWRDLAARAIEPNVFAEPEHVLPALRHFGSAGVHFLAAERDGRLAGLFPVRLERWRWGLPFLLAVHHIPYTPQGAPLVEAVAVEEICASLLSALAAMPGAPRAVLLPQIDENGPFAAVWRAAAARGQRGLAAFDAFARPALVPDPGEARAGYLATRVLKERRRRIEAVPRRIDRELGPLDITVARTPEEIAVALEIFMAVELSGWKGRRGTAIGARPQTAAFFRECLAELAVQGRVEIVTMRVPSATLASAMLVRSRDRMWFYKTAYDEQFGRYSPGFAIDIEVTGHVLADSSITMVDSLVTPPAPRFERLWCERLPMADWLTELDTERGGFSAAANLEALRRAARGRAKQFVGWARDRLGR